MQQQTAPLPAKNSANGYFPELESLRGWAISGVVLFHYFGILNGAAPLAGASPLWLKWIAAGNSGVTLFFVLSGFLLGGQFVSAMQAGRFPDVQRFLLLRALRILPLYYAVVLFAWLVSGNPAAFKALLFIPIGFSVFPYSVPWWSLSTEVQFYLLLPLLMYCGSYSVGRKLIVGALIVWLGMQFYLLHTPGWIQRHSVWDSSVFGRGLAFLMGCGAAWLYHQRFVRQLLGRRILLNSTFMLVLAGLLGLLAWYGEVGQLQARIDFPLFHNLEALLWAVLLLCLLSAGLLAKGVWVNPLMDHLGKISYSLYLVHVPILFYFLYPLRASVRVYEQAPQSTELISAVLLSLGCSWTAAMLCHYCIEAPFLRLKRYWSGTRVHNRLRAA